MKAKIPLLLLTALALAVAMPLLAQNEAPKAEITGEYSYLRFNPTLGGLPNINFNGGGFDASFFVRPYLGVKGDLMFYGSQDFRVTFGGPLATSAGFIPAGGYASNATYRSYLFGPIVKGRFKHFEPFAQILFGVARVDAYSNLSKVIAGTPGATLHVQSVQDPFALAVGGGVDIPVGKHLAVRVADFDYELTRSTNPLSSTNNQNHFRYAGGLQFRF